MGLRPPPAVRDVLCPRARVGVVRASALAMLTRISSRRSVDAVRSLHHALPFTPLPCSLPLDGYSHATLSPPLLSITLSLINFFSYLSDFVLLVQAQMNL